MDGDHVTSGTPPACPVEIRPIREVDLPAMLEIWNLYAAVLRDSGEEHTLATLTRWLHTQDEVQNCM